MSLAGRSSNCQNIESIILLQLIPRWKNDILFSSLESIYQTWKHCLLRALKLNGWYFMYTLFSHRHKMHFPIAKGIKLPFCRNLLKFKRSATLHIHLLAVTFRPLFQLFEYRNWTIKQLGFCYHKITVHTQWACCWALCLKCSSFASNSLAQAAYLNVKLISHNGCIYELCNCHWMYRMCCGCSE